MRYCKKCGTKITDENQRFCFVCGGVLPEVKEIEKFMPTENLWFILEEIDGSRRIRSDRAGFRVWAIYKDGKVLSYVGYDDDTYSEIRTVYLDKKVFNKLYDILRDFKNSPNPGPFYDGMNYNMFLYDGDQEYRRYGGVDHFPYFKNLVSLIKNIPGLIFSPVSTVRTTSIVIHKKTGKKKRT